MAMQLPTSVDVRALCAAGAAARASKLGRPRCGSAIWAGAGGAAGILRSPSGTMLAAGPAHQRAVRVFALLMGLRWARRKLLWRLRNRLIVTYVFIGVIPLMLLVAGALLAAYLFAGQFGDLRGHVRSAIGAADLDATTARWRRSSALLARDGKFEPALAGEIASASDENFRHRSVSIWEGEKASGWPSRHKPRCRRSRPRQRCRRFCRLRSGQPTACTCAPSGE